MGGVIHGRSPEYPSTRYSAKRRAFLALAPSTRRWTSPRSSEYSRRRGSSAMRTGFSDAMGSGTTCSSWPTLITARAQWSSTSRTTIGLPSLGSYGSTPEGDLGAGDVHAHRRGRVELEVAVPVHVDPRRGLAAVVGHVCSFQE